MANQEIHTQHIHKSRKLFKKAVRQGRSE